MPSRVAPLSVTRSLMLVLHTPVVEGELESLCDELSCLRGLNQLKALEFPLCIDSMGVDDNVVSGALV